MTGERFGHLQNKKALLKLEEEIKITGVKPYYVKDNVVQNKGYHASRVVCKSKDDAKICCAMLNLQSYWVNFYKKDWRHLIIERDNLKEENEELKQENRALKERIKNYPLCYTCKYCFIDDWYGICCENKDCSHYTRSWDLELQTECEYYEKAEEDDEDD